MSTTDGYKATLLPYVKSLDAERADALECWPRDYCHRDDRENSPDCDCYACTRTMQRRERQWCSRAEQAREKELRDRQRRTTYIDGKPILSVTYGKPRKWRRR